MKNSTSTLALLGIGLFAMVGAANAQNLVFPEVDSATIPSKGKAERATRANTDLPSKRYQMEIDFHQFVSNLAPLDDARFQPKAPNQVGITRSLSLEPDSVGRSFQNPDGSRMVFLAVRSPGAGAVRLRFEQFEIGPEDEVYVYGMSKDSSVSGPYKGKGLYGDGEFWTKTTEGDTAIIEWHRKEGSGSFLVSGIGHLYATPENSPDSPEVLSCEVDASCSTNTEKDSVARIVFVDDDDGLQYSCTGTLINDRYSDGRSFFLTANHCISSQSEARSIVAYWFYQSTGCNSGSLRNDWSSTQGANLYASSAADDFAFLEGPPAPSGARYAGWASGALGANTPVYGLHHPDKYVPPSVASYLRRADGGISNTNTGCSASGLVSGYEITWTSGLAEPGSSGSGLWWVNGSGQSRLVGVLSCGPKPPSCSTPYSSYSKFSNFFAQIQSFLYPQNTLTVASSNPPGNGVAITVSPTDDDGLNNGLTQFTRRYAPNVSVTLTAPLTVTSNGFSKWQRDGVDVSTNNTVVVQMNNPHTMTAVYNPTETIATPSRPSGSTSGQTGTNFTYSTGGSSSSVGHSVQYQFDWGDGTTSAWLAVGTTSANHSWSSGGTYLVRAHARCSSDTGFISSYSSNLSVTITIPEAISTPNTPSGTTSGSTSTNYSYSTGGSSSNIGHIVQYQFDWGDGTTSAWLAVGSTSTTHNWPSAGTYMVKAHGRCSNDTGIVSSYSNTLSVTITVPESISSPSNPTGSSTGSTGTSYTFSTGGSSSSLGHSVQYQFDWGDGSVSGWLGVGTSSASHVWAVAGTYSVTGQARCATDNSKVSIFSTPISVKINFVPSGVSVPDRAVIGLVANADGMYVTAENAGASPLIANRPGLGAWEQFQIFDLGDGTIALKSLINGKLVSAANGGSSPLIANRDTVGAWEQFRLQDAGNGNFVIVARANGKYVCAEDGGKSSLIANRTSAGGWEQFRIVLRPSVKPFNVTASFQAGGGGYISAGVGGNAALTPSRTSEGASEQFQITDVGNGNVAIRSLLNGRYVTAENYGKDPLIANREGVGTWEQFQLFDAGAGMIALRAIVNGQYVSVNNTGEFLIANRTYVGPLERFFLNISLRAVVNTGFVCADNYGNSPLIANRPSIGVWEQFQVVNTGDGNLGLRAKVNGMYVCADNYGNSPLIANRPSVGSWETFQWINGGNGNVVLKAVVNGMFVCAEDGGKSALIANRPTASVWEQFH